MLYFAKYKSPIGMLYLTANDNYMTELLFKEQKEFQVKEKQCAVMDQCIRELDLYFQGKLKAFTVPTAPKGTDFQKKVWEALRKIPYGETKSYQAIAEDVHCPLGSRAVGNANNKNPISIILPCHRVIGKNGKLVGYGGGLKQKEWLLTHELYHKNR